MVDLQIAFSATLASHEIQDSLLPMLLDYCFVVRAEVGDIGADRYLSIVANACISEACIPKYSEAS